MQNIQLGRFLQGCIRRMKKKLPSLEVIIEGEDCKEILIISDSELLTSILEK